MLDGFSHLLYDAFMVKDTQIGVRWDAAEYEALKRAADADQRAPSTLVRMIVVAWLKKNGWLKVKK